MLYFYIGLASIAICILNIISFSWFNVQRGSSFHLIVSLWLKDPIERVTIVQNDQDCPSGTIEYNIPYRFSGIDGLCRCVKKNIHRNVQNTNQTEIILADSQYQICSLLTCNQDQFKEHLKIDSLTASNLIYHFSIYSNGEESLSKMCVSKIEGYSFAKKAPIKGKCDEDEQYCSWSSSHQKNEDFDRDYGYCISSNRICQEQGVELTSVNLNYFQLPLVGFSLNTESSSLYNIKNYKQITTQQLLLQNYVTYSQLYDPYLQRNLYVQSQFMPRVQMVCRERLKEVLSSYIQEDVVHLIYLILMVLSIISMLSSFFISGLADLQDLRKCAQSNLGYHRVYFKQKTYNGNIPLYHKIFYIQKPIMLIVQIALLFQILRAYTPMIKEMSYLIDNECVDSNIRELINYGKPNSQLFNSNLALISFWLCIFNFFTDINVYLFLKQQMLFILQPFITCFQKLNNLIQQHEKLLEEQEKELDNLAKMTSKQQQNPEKQKKNEQLQNTLSNSQKIVKNLQEISFSQSIHKYDVSDVQAASSQLPVFGNRQIEEISKEQINNTARFRPLGEDVENLSSQSKYLVFPQARQFMVNEQELENSIQQYKYHKNFNLQRFNRNSYSSMKQERVEQKNGLIASVDQNSINSIFLSELQSPKSPHQLHDSKSTIIQDNSHRNE